MAVRDGIDVYASLSDQLHGDGTLSSLWVSRYFTFPFARPMGLPQNNEGLWLTPLTVSVYPFAYSELHMSFVELDTYGFLLT